jgi:hypothetical protein
MWRRPNEGMAVLAAVVLVGLGGTSGLDWDAVRPGWHPAYVVLLVTGLGALVFLFYRFPDGRFVPRWTRWAFAPWLAWFGLGVAATLLRRDLSAVYWLVMTLLTLGLFALGGLAQIYRYRRVSTPVQRQQTKWVVLGFAVLVLSEVLLTAYLELIRPALGQAPPSGAAYRVAGTLFDVATLGLLPFSLGFAILRSRLWDIDPLIRRTLIYSSLTAMLAAAYLGIVLALQTAFQLVTGESRGPLVTLLSTLAIAALFGPLRGWVQRAIDRRFFRQRYDAAAALARFGYLSRDDVDLDHLTESLLATVDETLQPAAASVWFRPAAAARLDRPDPR